MKILIKSLIVLFICASTTSAQASESKLDWREFNAEAFDNAKKQNKYLILDLVAVWCHWCHVMEETTYTNSDVINLLKKNYITLKADHDARPDLAERYRDYGWPATVIYNPEGQEILMRAGYIAPDDMLSILRGIVREPPPALAFSLERTNDDGKLADDIRRELLVRHQTTYDDELGGLAIAQKFLDEGAIGWDMHLAELGDSASRQRVRQTLDAGIKLIDPEFGGAYQYSTGYVWTNPHYEKIMRTQAKYLRLYTLAYETFGDPKYRRAAETIVSYINEFLSDKNGGFYTSQDADLVQGSKAHDYFKLEKKQRLAQGLPRIDKHQYAGENGMMIEGLVKLYQATKNTAYLQRANKALAWVLMNRRQGNGFKHDTLDKAGPYLSDNLYMARAFLSLYEVSKDPRWLKQATNTATFMTEKFFRQQGGFNSAVDNGTPIKPAPQLDQNIAVAEFFIALAKKTKLSEHIKISTHIMRYLSSPDIALSRATDAGILLLDNHYQTLVNQMLSADARF